MAKAKLSLTANPTFKAMVEIPIPGADAAQVEFVFKGRTRTELSELLMGLADKDDADTLMDIACGWELSDPFDKTNIDKMNENYIGAASAVIKKYLSELTAARLGN